MRVARVTRGGAVTTMSRPVQVTTLSRLYHPHIVRYYQVHAALAAAADGGMHSRIDGGGGARALLRTVA